MRLTKFSHSCVRFEDGSRSLVIDPGVHSESAAALDGAQAVLITHEHADHLDPAALLSAVKANPGLRVWAPAGVAVDGVEVTEVQAGQTFEAAGFAVETFGGQHAVVHPSISVIGNVSYLVAGRVYHPGDSFAVPTKPVQTLLVPIHAPWSKIAEVIDFMVSVRAPQAFQIHDGLLNEAGLQVSEAHLTRIGGSYGSEFRHLSAGSSLDV
ncbi:MAG: MBL fold metallo-hydrolase [Actinomycetota bacterium]